jgi:D-mannonate dehydratase
MEEGPKCEIHNLRYHTVCTLTDCTSSLICSRCISLHKRSHARYFIDLDETKEESLKKLNLHIQNLNLNENKSLLREEVEYKKVYNSLLSNYFDKMKDFYDKEIEIFFNEINLTYQERTKNLFHPGNFDNSYELNNLKERIECYNRLDVMKKNIEECNNQIIQEIKSKQQKLKNDLDFSGDYEYY